MPRRLLMGAALLILLQGCASNPPAATPGESAHAEAKAAYLANDFQRTLAIVEPLAIGGEAWAQYTLGYMYYYGRGVAMDRQMAKQWIQRAAQQAYAPAQQALHRLSSSEPRHNNEEGMEPRAGDTPAPQGRAPMPIPPSGEAPATPAPSPEIPPGRAPMPTPPPQTANPTPVPPAGEASPAAPPNDNTMNPSEQPPAVSPGIAPSPTTPAPSVDNNAAPGSQAMPAPENPSAPPAQDMPPAAGQTPTNEAPAPAPSAQTAPAINTTPPPTAHAAKDIKGPGWIAAQDPQNYTLQLLGAGNEQAVIRFIRDHHLEQQAAYFAQTRNGGAWYTVLYGSFPDRQAARQALGRLPASVERASPWIRRFADVQTRLAP